MSHYNSYPRHVDTNIPWLKTIPSEWTMKRLRYTATYRNSNVDKKNYPGQRKVFLCNYTDVYYNEFIQPGIAFMSATASPSEIASFQLRAGDIIITKDSEDPEDIGIPAFVSEDMPGVVCGYHLCVIRVENMAIARYLHRLLQSDVASAHFFIESPGVTRFGLNQEGIGNLPVPLPKAGDCQAIADHLDRETARIDALIERKTRFIELLKEKRQALITQAVTKGLDPTVPRKDSGVEWIGEVPVGWDVVRVKHVAGSITSGPRGWSDLITETGDSAFIQSGDLSDEGKVLVKKAQSINAPRGTETTRARLEEGDVLVCITGAKTGRVALMHFEEKTAYLNQHLSRARPRDDVVKPEFLNSALSSGVGRTYFDVTQYGLKQGLGLDDVRNAPVALPPKVEQELIVKHIDSETKRIDRLSSFATRSINLLKERRAALITAAVTGQIDLREETP